MKSSARTASSAATIYMGLFLMAFALYASSDQSAKLLEKTIVKTVEVAKEAEQNSSSARLEKLYKNFIQNPLFAAKTDGFRLSRTSKQITLRLYSDDVYPSGDPAVRESWYSALDQVAEIILPETSQGLKLQIKGYADRDNALERSPDDYGKSDYAFSFARAEWLAHYFEHKSGLNLRAFVEVTGMGAHIEGKKAELVFHYSED